MSNYQINKRKSITINDEPTMTDQSQAAQTDINVIVTQFLRTGQAPGQQTPVYGDFTEFPTDLKTMFDLARSVKDQMQTLPKELQGVPLATLVNMTNEQINAILAKPAPKPEDKKEDAK